MTTNLAIISDAMRLLGVISEIESPSAEQGEHALRRLNQMIEEWTESDIQLGYYEQSSTTDDCPIPKWAERGVVSKLAQDLHATYPSGALTADVLDDARNGYGMILRKAVVDALKPADMSSMPLGEGHYGSGWDITNG